MKVNIRLSASSIRGAIRQTEEAKLKIHKACDECARLIVERGVEITRQNIQALGLKHSVSLVSSVRYEKISDCRYKIIVGDIAGVFVEYGTGSRAGEYPGGAVTHKKSSWYTKADGKPMDTLYGWTPLTGQDGSIYYKTYGQPSRHFFWDMLQEIKRPEFIDECWKEACRNVGL